MSIVRRQATVFFPWERRRGLRSVFRGGRARKVLFLALGVALLGLLLAVGAVMVGVHRALRDPK